MALQSTKTGDKDSPKAQKAHAATVPSPSLLPGECGVACAGNMAIQRRFGRSRLQAKLAIGATNDEYEREADEIAARVVSGANGMQVARTSHGSDAQLAMSHTPNASVVQRLGAPVLQRQPNPQTPTQNQSSTSNSPGLGPATSQTVDGLIKAGNFQDAVNAVVAKKAADGQINLNLLAGKQMNFDAGLTSADGSTSMPSWDAISNHADPATVRIGPSAFSSVPYLYSVILHEYQHVTWQQTQAHQQVSHTAHQQGFESPDEVEAGEWELIHGEESGISKLPDKVAQIWNNLNDSYWKLASNDQPGERALVLQAQQKAKQFTKGAKVTLNPFSDPSNP